MHIVIPEINSICKYMFIPKFDRYNGIYKLTQHMSFESILDANIDLTEKLYTPSGLTKEDYNVDQVEYRKKTVLFLTNVETNEVLYAPEPILARIPDPMVIRCHNLNVAINLGYFMDPSKIAWMMDELNDISTSVTGTTNSAILTSSEYKWMTQAEYDIIEEDRTTRVQSITTLTKEIRDMRALVESLLVKIDDYENLLLTLNTP